MNEIKTYTPYFNSPCLERWALECMINNNLNSNWSKILIYGDYGYVLIEDKDNYIMYQYHPHKQLHPNQSKGEIFIINKSECYEIDYHKVYALN